MNTSMIKILIFVRDEERRECKIIVNGKSLEHVNKVVDLQVEMEDTE